MPTQSSLLHESVQLMLKPLYSSAPALPALSIGPFSPIEVSDEITVELVEQAASDVGVVKAARVSTVGLDANREDRGGDEMAGLVSYLMRSRHGSPFEHNFMTFLISAPIFTVRHLMRHRTWSFNEESARYREMQPRFYVPGPDRRLKQVGKPGHYRYVAGSPGDHERLTRVASESYASSYASYSKLLDAGVARELARMVLPGATFSTVFATCNARSLMHFLSLRTQRDGAAYPSSPQREIEIVAEQMEAEFARLMPVTHAAFEKFGRVSP
jgi:thymidylate synthase (FAD)